MCVCVCVCVSLFTESLSGESEYRAGRTESSQEVMHSRQEVRRFNDERRVLEVNKQWMGGLDEDKGEWEGGRVRRFKTLV